MNKLTAKTSPEQIKVIPNVELGADITVMWCQQDYAKISYVILSQYKKEHNFCTL